MNKFSAEFKSELAKKALTDGGIIKEIAKEANVGRSTLQRWIREYKNGTTGESLEKGKRTQDWTEEEQFIVLLETANLDEEAQGVYCRQKGLYRQQLTSWKTSLMSKLKNPISDGQREELKKLRVANKELKRDVRHKERALAETAALLVLKKKAALIWGEIEDD